MRPATLILLSTLLLCLGLADPAAAQDDVVVALSGGLFDVADHQDIVELGVEIQSRPYLWELRLSYGLMINTESAGYSFVGLRRELPLTEAWGLSIGFAAGAYGFYRGGDGVDLGGELEFRTLIELFRELSPRSRLGIAGYHLSHAGINGERNPGANSIVLVYGRRFSARRR